MKITDQQLCIYGLFTIAIGSLFAAPYVVGGNQTMLLSIPTSVVSGILGYLRGKGDKD